MNFAQNNLEQYIQKAKEMLDKTQLALNTIHTAREQINQSPLAQKHKHNALLLCRMLKDSISKEYKYLSPSAIIIPFAALLYIVADGNRITSKLPFLKDMTNMAVLTYALHTVESELKTYSLWLATKDAKKG